MFRGKRRLILHFYNVCHIDNNSFTSAFINNSNSYLVLSKLSFNIMYSRVCVCVCVCTRARACVYRKTPVNSTLVFQIIYAKLQMKRAPWLSVQICAQDYSKIEYIFVSKYLELLDKSVEKKYSSTFRKSVCRIMYKRRNLIINTINDQSLADYE